MDFNYSNEQTALRETLQRFIDREYDFEHRRELAESALGYSSDTWARFAEFGLLSLPYPEEFGGFGGNAVDVMLVMELIGRGLLLEPFLSTVVMCGGLIRDAGSPPLKRSLLPRIGTGEIKLALACYEASARYDLSQVTCTAAPGDGGGWRLSGQKTVVLDAPSADYFLVSACAGAGDSGAGASGTGAGSNGAGDPRGVSMFLVEREAQGSGAANTGGDKRAPARILLGP